MRLYLGGILSAIRLLVLLTWTAPAWCVGVGSEGEAARLPETACPWDLSASSLDEVRLSSVTTPGDELWWDGFGLPSINGQVVCAVEYQGSIVVGGLFEQAGARLVYNIARWNGSGWEPLGSGMDNWVLTLGVFDGDLIAGGSFQHAGGVAASGIARWDGESWSAMGPGLWFIPNNTNVNALAVDGSTLVAGGYFATSGTTAVKNIARWNGASWESIGEGVDLHVLALAVRSGVLYAGGRRGRDRTIPQYLAEGGGLAMWNGVTWESVGGGLQPGCCSPDVHSLSVHGDRLVVGGVFGRVGGVLDASNIAGWDGGSWTSLGEGHEWAVLSTFSAAGDVLYAGGNFGLRFWDGSSWNAVPGIDGEVRALHSAGNDLLAAGDFQTSGPGNAKAFCVARYAGGSWHGFDYWTEQMRGLASNGRSPTVLWLTTYGDHLVAGGFFNHAGDPPSWGARDRIAEWDGVQWTTLPPLPAGRLMAATEWNGTLYVSGDFPSGNPVRPFIPVYRLEPNGWMPVGTSAFPPQVKTMAVYQGALHIATRSEGGGYVGAIQRLTGNQWETIGEVTTDNGYILLTSMVEFDGKLVVAGRFKAVDGVAALNVAMWDGSRWEQFGMGLPAPVSSDAVSGLAVHEGSLVATGQISPPGTPPNSIVRWSGSQWDAMGSLTTPFASLGTAYGDLFLIGSTSGLGMRRWDGQTWAALGSGTQGTVRDVLGHGGYVYMGGSLSRAGGKSSFGMARWGPTTTSVEPTAELAPLAPNPFRSSTSLTYRVPEAGSVRVSVHDVMGREIAVLAHGSKSPGTYGAVWDGKDERGNLAPAGVYFIRAELPGADLARKVVRLR